MARRALLLLHAAALAVLYLALCRAEPHSGSSPLPNPADHSPLRKQVSSLISFRGNQPVEPQFCVIVRTYWGHSGSHHHGLRRLIRSLRRQTVQRWEAVFVVMDDKPFQDLHHILAEFNDDRLWVFAEWIGTQFMPKRQGEAGAEWMPGYHGMLYNLTDDAVQVCPKDTRWLIITNGDNEYAENFMQKVVEAGDTDVVAFDFYSRFQRPTAPPCERFAWWAERPNCKTNRLKWCHTDLGANVINYPKFVTEQRRFGMLQSQLGLQADHYDGIMAQTLVEAGWRVHHVYGSCLFSHAPSPQWCGWQGGVWDDIDIVNWDSAGGRCISYAQREEILATRSDVEEVIVLLSNDGNVSAFEGVEPAHLQIRCLRKRALRDAQMRAVAWYSLYCTEDADVPMVQEILETPEYQALVAPHTHQELNRALYIPAGSRMIPDPPRRDGSAGEPEFRKRYNPPSEERDARLDAALDAAVAAQQAEAAAAAAATAAQAAAAQQAGAAQQGPAATEHTLQQ